MSALASQITSPTIVYSSVYSGADQWKHQSSAPLAFVWGIHRCPVNSPHKWPVTRKCFHLMTSSWMWIYGAKKWSKISSWNVMDSHISHCNNKAYYKPLILHGNMCYVMFTIPTIFRLIIVLQNVTIFRTVTINLITDHWYFTARWLQQLCYDMITLFKFSYSDYCFVFKMFFLTGL